MGIVSTSNSVCYRKDILKRNFMTSSVHPPEIGPRIKAVRQERKLTLEKLAEISNISKSLLSDIERGKANPTIATLWSLTGALGLSLSDLVNNPSQSARDPVIFVTSYNTPQLGSLDGQCSLRILSPMDQAGRMEWYLLEFVGKGELRSDPHTPGTKEHLTVLSGHLTVESLGRKIDAAPGDTVRYPGDVDHVIINNAEVPASAVLVVMN